MKKSLYLSILVLLIAVLCLSALVACNDNNNINPPNPGKEVVDYVSQLKLDLNSSTAKIIDAKVRVVNGVAVGYIDGDTTHFSVDKNHKDYDLFAQGVLKARYLAVDTPESTGIIEDYGKTASNFTREKLAGAQSIVIESDTDDGKWNTDSTNVRYLVWVWYRNSETEDYRNLNLEILQSGLAAGSKTGNNRYGEVCTKALTQARDQKLYLYSGKPDPDTYHGEAIELTLKQLRLNAETYKGKIVAFEAVVAKVNENTVYVQEFDAETERYFGIQIFLGYNQGTFRDIMTGVGNRVRVVGSMQYYESGGTYQIADIRYRDMKPDDPRNVQLLEKNVNVVATEITGATLTDNVTIEVPKVGSDETEMKSFESGLVAMNTLVSMKGLVVTDVYTTNNGGNSDGAMSLTCTTTDGKTITVRTEKLYDSEGKLITAAALNGKTIDVVGIVDYYNGAYQVRVLVWEDIAVK